MQQWNRVDTDKRFKAFLTHRTIYEVIRIRTVEHKKFNAVLSTRLHDIMHCAYICIETCAYILNIEYNHIQPA